MKAFLLFALWNILSVNSFAQSDNDVLKKQAEKRRNNPDYIDNRKMIANPQQSGQKDSVQTTKKHKCWCHKKKHQKPAAKDALKDRNTKDPKLEKIPPKVELQGGN